MKKALAEAIPLSIYRLNKWNLGQNKNEKWFQIYTRVFTNMYTKK